MNALRAPLQRGIGSSSFATLSKVNRRQHISLIATNLQFISRYQNNTNTHYQQHITPTINKQYSDYSSYTAPSVSIGIKPYILCFSAYQLLTNNYNDDDVAYCMGKSTSKYVSQSSGQKGGMVGKDLEKLDLDDPSDRAFNLVYNYGVPVSDALKCNGNPCHRSAIYARVERWDARRAKDEASEALLSLRTSTSKSPHPTTTPNKPPQQKLPTITRGSSIKKGMKRKSRTNVGKIDTVKAAKAAAIETQPKWMDTSLTSKSMNKRHKRTTKQVNIDNFETNAVNDYRTAKYINAFKGCTLDYEKNKGKKGFGVRAVIDKWNKNKLSSPNDRKISKTRVLAAVGDGKAGVTPPKLGRPRKVPKELTATLAAHATMMQVAGEGEAKGASMVATAQALTVDTPWEDKLDPHYVWRKTRRDHPAVLNPTSTKDNEDRRVDWLTFKNINEWTSDAAKKELIDMGMVKDEPGIINGVESEVSLYHPDDLRFFLNTDETQHKFSNARNKGGSTAQTWSNASFPRSGERITESSRHTTGCYTVNAAGEALPCLYIFDSKAKDQENYQVPVHVCDGLPRVTGKYGLDKLTRFPSFVSVRSKGSMDSSLWVKFVEDVILPCYPNISKTIERCSITGKILKGPVILKTDAGPGRLATDAENWEFRRRWNEKGLYILLGLPNGTSATQEMDQGYEAYQKECKKSTLRVASRKMNERVKARKKAAASDNEPATEEELEEFVHEEGSPDDAVEDEDEYYMTHKGSVCNVTLGNDDLPHMVNGFPGDSLDNRPFDKTFTEENIIGWWKATGFMPMTRNALNDLKVRWEWGEGGAPEEASERMELLLKEYKEGGKKLTEMGFNGDVLDLEPDRVVEAEPLAGQEERVQALIKGNTMSKAGRLNKIGIKIANCDDMLEAKKRIDEAAKKKKEKGERDKIYKNEQDDYKATKLFELWKKKGRPMQQDGKPKLGAKTAEAILKVLLPLIAPNERMSQHKNMGPQIDRLLAIQGGTTWEAEMDAYAAKVVEKYGRPAEVGLTGSLFSVDKPEGDNMTDS